ncbi:ABC transporter ATP-binding protein [Oscillibacter sp.]|uniref:ABC transporter ATP-binding protein n=1 Tax=Oscillibacter sp. TaxID=1945593 RepID=UPI0037CBA2C0
METTSAVLMKQVTKRFGEVVANDGVDLELRRGEILSLLGENGSGKTTLMNMLSGIYFPDGGQIYVNGQAVSICCPRDAFDLGIGMIHQHFKLVDVFTAAENIVLGLTGEGKLDRKAIAAKVKNIADKYGFDIDPNQKIYDMSVSQKQTVEIVKVLYRGADILILDEPTAVLTPQETDKLFAVMRNMKADGKALVIITHKLHEVMDVSDRVAVLRKGKFIGDVSTCDTDPQKLTDMMVGRAVELNIDCPKAKKTTERIEIQHLTVKDKDGVPRLSDVSFTARGGEILGIAGIAGSGQKQLLEAIAGLQLCEPGSSILYKDEEWNPTAPANDPENAKHVHELIGKSPLDIMKMGVALSFVPEDRLGMGLVANMDLTDNMLLRSYLSGRGVFADRKKPKKLAETVVDELEVVTPSVATQIRKLSGGNVQKVLVGREIAMNPTVLMSAYAVRGLDINTSYTIYNLMTEQKLKGVAVIYVGEDLDVLLELCDRIVVLCGGQVSGVVPREEATKEGIGLLMTQFRKEGAAS